MSDEFDHFPKNHYSVILADPPWLFTVRSDKGVSKSPQAKYRCMGIDWIMSLPVADLLADDAVLAMWATAPMMREAFDTLDAWGFRYKTMAAWAKQSSTGAKWAFGTGYIFRSAAEFLVIGTKGRPKQKVRNVRNLIVAPVREHSRKPDIIYDIVESLWDGPYLELFSRTARPGWDAFGDQTGKFNDPTEGSPSPSEAEVVLT